MTSYAEKCAASDAAHRAAIIAALDLDYGPQKSVVSVRNDVAIMNAATLRNALADLMDREYARGYAARSE